MGDAFVDTNVIVRLLTGDDASMQRQAKLFFERIERGELQVTAPITVIADTVFVLSSPRLYNLPRTEIVALLIPLLRLRGFRLRNRRIVMQSLDIYLAHNLDYGDAVIVAWMQHSQSQVVYSFDHDFDHIPGITRKDP